MSMWDIVRFILYVHLYTYYIIKWNNTDGLRGGGKVAVSGWSGGEASRARVWKGHPVPP